MAAAEKKKKEAEEEAKRIEEASNSTVSISVLRKKGNPYTKQNQTLARASLLLQYCTFKNLELINAQKIICNCNSINSFGKAIHEPSKNFLSF